MMLVIAAVALASLDGALTYIGISRWGLGVEANPVIRWLIVEMGLVPALMLTRIVAFAVVVFLYRGGHETTLIIFAALFLFVAVLPWCYILLRWS